MEAGKSFVKKPVHADALEGIGPEQMRTRKAKLASLEPPIKMCNYFEKTGAQQDKESRFNCVQQLTKKKAKSIIAAFKTKNRTNELGEGALTGSPDSMPSLDVPAAAT